MDEYERGRVKMEKDMQRLLDPIYRKLGYEIISRKGEIEHDLILRKEDTTTKEKIEEKIVRAVFPYLTIELLQKAEIGEPGWLYMSKADYIHFVMCEDGKPAIIHRFNLKKFRDWYADNCEKYRKFRWITEGRGKTLCHLIPPQDIPGVKIFRRKKEIKITK